MPQPHGVAHNGAMKHAQTRRHWLASAAGGLLGLAGPAWGTVPPPPESPAPQDGSWTDAARQRTVPWRLRLPAAPMAATPTAVWPLVVYSHGLGGSREGAALWGQAWAADGVAVLHLDHAGSNAVTARAGLRALRQAASAEQLRMRVADIRFALDQLQRLADQGMAPWAAMRLDALGVAGHSFGAHTVQAVAGQRYAVAAELTDPRPKAFIAFSPSQPAGEGMALQESFGGGDAPMFDRFTAIAGSLPKPAWLAETGKLWPQWKAEGPPWRAPSSTPRCCGSRRRKTPGWT
jgi:predicted dienelactone hydrolase